MDLLVGSAQGSGSWLSGCNLMTAHSLAEVAGADRPHLLQSNGLATKPHPIGWELEQRR